MPDAPTQPAEPLDRATDAATELDGAAVRSVYRAIWNSDYDVDVSLKGRTAAHALAEQMAGALAKDGLLAPPMAEGLDYSALADACDDYVDAYRGDGPDERIGVAAARVRGAAELPAVAQPAGSRVAIDNDGDTWNEIEPGLFKARCGRGHQCDVPGECHSNELLLAELAHGYGLRSLTAPSLAVDRETLVELLAERALGRYASEYNADHLTWRDFADDAGGDLDALIAAGAIAGAP